MTVSNYDNQTRDQKLRDERLVDLISKRIVSPMLDEMESLVHGYSSLADSEKISAILRLNERYAPNGHMVTMEFGVIDGVAIGYQCSMFSGVPLEYQTFDFGLTEDGPTVYVPEYTFNADLLGTHRHNLEDAQANGHSNGLMDYILHSEQYESDFWSLPIAYRFAIAAHALRENVFCSFVDACRFVVGIDSSLTLRRWNAEMLESNDGQVFGWRIEVRDSMPPIDLFKHIARNVREKVGGIFDALAAVEYSVSDGNGDVETVLGRQPLFSDAIPHKRGPRESTRVLIEFIDEYLPSIGRYVGTSNRRDGCKKTSWIDAYDLFSEKYPDMYSSVESMRGSYQNAKAKKRHARKARMR